MAEWSEGNKRTQGNKGHKGGFMGGERKRDLSGFLRNLDEYNQGFLLPITAVSKFILNFAVTSAIAHHNLSKKTSISDDKSR